MLRGPSATFLAMSPSASDTDKFAVQVKAPNGRPSGLGKVVASHRLPLLLVRMYGVPVVPSGAT